MVLAVIMIASIGIVSASAESYEAHISGNGVNFRVGPGTSYAVRGAYCYGTAVIVDQVLENGWCKVTIFGVSGYVYGAYVTRGVYSPTQTGLASTPLSNEAAYINTDNVNFRMAPSTSYASLGVLSKGTAVTLVRYVANGWYEIRINNFPGYVFGDYITKGAYTATTELITVKNDYSGAPLAAYINTASVVIRSSPSSNSTALTTMQKGYPISVVAEYSNDWYGITYKNLNGSEFSGYVYGPYVTIGDYMYDTVYSITRTPVDYYGYVNKSNTPMRVAPDDSYAVITTLPIGIAFHIVTEISNGWLEVISGNGVNGYIYGPYITVGTYSGDPVATDKPAEIVPISFVAYNGTVNTDNVPFSVYPANGYAIMAYIPAGTPVQVTITYNNGWCEAYINGNRGYIYSSYVS